MVYGPFGQHRLLPPGGNSGVALMGNRFEVAVAARTLASGSDDAVRFPTAGRPAASR